MIVVITIGRSDHAKTAVELFHLGFLKSKLYANKSTTPRLERGHWALYQPNSATFMWKGQGKFRQKSDINWNFLRIWIKIHTFAFALQFIFGRFKSHAYNGENLSKNWFDFTLSWRTSHLDIKYFDAVCLKNYTITFIIISSRPCTLIISN